MNSRIELSAAGAADADPVLTSAAHVQGVYDRVADSYADHFARTTPEQPAELGMIAQFASLLPGSPDVLDAGCGPGRMIPVLEGHGCAVSGIDLSGAMIRRAAGDFPGRDLRQASFDALPHGDGAFDGVLSWYSTIHADDDTVRRMFQEAKRVLRPGGCVLVAFQTARGVREVGSGYRALGHDVTLLRHGRPVRMVAGFLQDAGFAVWSHMERSAVGDERDGQAVVIAQLP